MKVPTRDMVVLGGSAGSIEAISRVLEHLPRSLPATVFIVMHLYPRQRSHMPAIFGKHASLPVRQAVDGDPIETGRIYVAAPDRHLLIAENHIHLTRGPKEGLHRPSINMTFRSAADVYGPRVIGVVLSGMLDDGAAGLWEIARHGGVTLVQDPGEASFSSMPESALQGARIDYKLKAAEIGVMIGRIVNGEEEPPGRTADLNPAQKEEFSGFTCPECRGPLYTKKGEGPAEFRCRVGHVISLGTLIEESGSTQERKLYEAIVALEEGSDLARLAAGRATGGEKDDFLREADQLKEFSSAIRSMIERRQTSALP